MTTDQKNKVDIRIQKLPLFQILITPTIIVLILSPRFLYLVPNIDLFTFFAFSIPGIMSFVWATIYIIAFILGYGLTNTPTYQGARTLKNIDLVKPKYVLKIERFFLALFCIMLLAISFVSFIIIAFTPQSI